VKTAFKQLSAACPEGFYCPANFHNPIPCPPGKYGVTTSTTQTESARCVNCDAGTYIDSYGMSKTDYDLWKAANLLNCSPGFKCAAGSTTKY
jgi:hypothetical protein